VLNNIELARQRFSQAGYLAVIHKCSGYVIPAGIAGQIGRTADLHGIAARRVRDMDVSHASSPQGGETVGWKLPESNTCSATSCPPWLLDSGNPCRNDGFSGLAGLEHNDENRNLGNR